MLCLHRLLVAAGDVHAVSVVFAFTHAITARFCSGVYYLNSSFFGTCAVQCYLATSHLWNVFSIPRCSFAPSRPPPLPFPSKLQRLRKSVSRPRLPHFFLCRSPLTPLPPPTPPPCRVPYFFYSAGNVLVAGGDGMGTLSRSVGALCGVDFDPQGSRVVDHFTSVDPEDLGELGGRG